MRGLANSPHQSNRTFEAASDLSEIETKRLNSSCSMQDHENIIIETRRIGTAWSKDKTHQDHIADRGHVSMSHYNMVCKYSQFQHLTECA